MTGLKEFIYMCCINMQQIAHISSTDFEGVCYQESLYKCTWSRVSHLKNWKCNREPDKQKVSEIVQSITDGSYAPMPLIGFIVMNVGEKIPQVEIYDGGHRLQAYQEINQKESKCQFDILLHALINPPQELVYQRFKNINKMSPVTELYTRVDNTEEYMKITKKVIEVGKRFRRKYKKNASTSDNPHVPNYNKFQLQEDFRTLCLECKHIQNMEECEIMGIFEKINDIFKQKVEKTIKDDLHKNPKVFKQVEKAMNADCYIFICGRKAWMDVFVSIL